MCFLALLWRGVLRRIEDESENNDCKIPDYTSTYAAICEKYPHHLDMMDQRHNDGKSRSYVSSVPILISLKAYDVVSLLSLCTDLSFVSSMM